jgi:hypothetical protein
MPEIIIIATKQCQAYSLKKKTQVSRVNLMYIASALICTNQAKLDNASRLIPVPLEDAGFSWN